MIWDFTEFRSNKKNENMTFYIQLILNFPLNMQAAIFHLSVT